MSQPQLATFKYDHTDPAIRGRQRMVWVWVTGGVALVVSGAAFPPGLLALLVPAIIYFSAPRQLHVGPRYLICGRQIAYYGNVVRLVLDEPAGELRIESASGAQLVLERDKFPTNARKTDKVAKNKAAKFTKVSAKIAEKVRAFAPDAVVTGFPS